MSLQLTICLCILAACAGASTVRDCNGSWWRLSNQSVKVRNPSLGTTHVAIKYEEVFWTGSRPMIRETSLSGSKFVALSSGWVEIYSNSDELMVPANANFQVAKSERLIFISKFRANIEGTLKMGYNMIEVGDVRYEYTVTRGGWCRAI